MPSLAVPLTVACGLVDRLTAGPFAPGAVVPSLVAQAGTPDREVFALTNLPQSAWLFLYIAVVAAAAVGVVGLYLWESARVAAPVRLGLAALRLGVVGLLAWVFLGPAIIGYESRERLPVVAVLRDASQSMNVADMPGAVSAGPVLPATDGGRPGSSGAGPSPPGPSAGGRTRAETVNDALAAAGSVWLDPLRRQAKVRVYDFGEATRPVATLPLLRDDPPSGSERSPGETTRPRPDTARDADAAGSGGLTPLAAEDRATDLHGAITEALQASPLSGIVVFTDGQHNGPLDPTEVARVAGRRNVPIHVVGLGDPRRPANLRVLQVYATNPAWQDEPFEVEAVVEGQGLTARAVTARLVRHAAPEEGDDLGDGEEVDRAELALPEGGGRARHVFRQTLRQPGRFVYRVAVDPVAEEVTTEDNARNSDVVKVLSRERIRVLLVSGAPSWDYTLVERLLLREPSVEVSCWLQTLDADRPQAGDTPIERLPRTREELFAYDVILLMDPSPEEFDEKWVGLIKEFVGDHAGGLLYMAGPRSSGYFLFGPRTGGVRDVLPVRFEGVTEADLIPTMASHGQSWPLRVAPTAADHPLLAVEGTDDVLKRWENLPGVYWSFPASTVRPAADVLLEHGDPTLAAAGAEFRPLMAVGRYGAGPVVYLGYHGTWRWRSVGRDAEFFDKFWIQACRYLTDARSLEGRRRGYLQAERPRYEIGDRVRITAELRDAAYQPLVKDEITARLYVADESPRDVAMSPLPDQPGRYEAVYLARRLGPQTVRLDLPDAAAAAPADGAGGGPGGAGGRLEANYLVELPRLEATQNWQNEPLLREIASLSGGRYLTIDRTGELPDLLLREPERFEVAAPPVFVWDRWWLLATLGVLLALEWTGRKLTRMM